MSSDDSFVFLFLGGFAIVLGIYTLTRYLRVRRFILDSLQTTGRIVDIVERNSLANEERRFSRASRYVPVIEFTPASGKKPVRFLAESTSHKNVYKKGEAVPVRYVKATPEQACIDRFFPLWKQPLMALMGSIALIVALFFGLR